MGQSREGVRNVRKLGIIGGTSWASTALYYQHLNRGVAARLGGLHSALLCIESLDMLGLAQRTSATAIPIPDFKRASCITDSYTPSGLYICRRPLLREDG